MKLFNAKSSELLEGWIRKCYSSKSGLPVPSKDGSGEQGVNTAVVKVPLPASEPCEAGPCYAQPKVVIIGAGMAGLSAAHRLVQCGINNFTVLEATCRPGGRIHSCWLGDAVAEIGSHWGSNQNKTNSSLYSMASGDELARSRSESTRGLFSRASGGEMDLPITVSAYQRFRQIEKEASQLFCYGNSKQHGSMLNFLGMRIQQELRDFPEDQQYDAARIMFGMASILRNKCGDDLSLVCSDCVGNYLEMPGGEVRVPLGTVGAIAPLLRELPDCTVHYCKPVNIVHWGTAQKAGFRAVVRCCDGEEFPADYVIVTVSMGVLRRFADAMFCPTLPAGKIDAIRFLNWIDCNKVYLDYSRPFWFWSKSDLKFEFSADCLCGRSDWTRGVREVAPVPESEHVLQLRVVGPEARQLETLSDRDVAEGVTRLLRELTGDQRLPYPATMLRSRWSADHYFCGAYSGPGCACGCGCDPELSALYQMELGTPTPGPSDSVPPVLLFAGEATVPGHAGTVEAARLSGVREAERIVQLTNRLRGPPLPPLEPELTPQERQEGLAEVKRDCNKIHAKS